MRYGFQNMDMDGNCAGQGQQIRGGLGHLYACKVEGQRQKQYRRDEKHALPGRCQECGRHGAVDGLLHHVAHDDPALGREGQALESQGGGAALDDRRIIPEKGDQIGGKHEHQPADQKQEHQTGAHAEPEAFLHPVEQAGAVIESAYRLESLAEADHGGGAEHHDPLYYAHGGDGSVVSVGAGGVVQADGGHRGQALPGKRGQAALDDLFEIIPAELYLRKPDADVAALAAADAENDEADQLADDGGPAGAGHAQTAGEDQQRIQGDV